MGRKKTPKNQTNQDLKETPVLIQCSSLANGHMQISEISGGMHT